MSTDEVQIGLQTLRKNRIIRKVSAIQAVCHKGFWAMENNVPNAVNRKVMPRRGKRNGKKYLTQQEVEQLQDAAKGGRDNTRSS
jgi:hypothetical protein